MGGAIPVSLIGTFALLLAFGFSANTISLLAMVLGIGVVVDDAIVVVENVERVMAEEPELSPKEATKEAVMDADHRGPVIAISLVLLSGVRTRSPSFQVFFGHAVPPVRGDDQHLDAALGDHRPGPCSPALCALFLRHGHRPRGPVGWMLDRDRQGPGTGIPTSLPGCCDWRPCLCSQSKPPLSGIVLLGKITPTGFLPEEDQGAIFSPSSSFPMAPRSCGHVMWSNRSKN